MLHNNDILAELFYQNSFVVANKKGKGKRIEL